MNKFGAYETYIDEHGQGNNYDLGAFNSTGKVNDLYLFRVPSLRNVEKTAPYFHDGSAQTLEDAVFEMAEHQLGRKIDIKKTKAIVAFLITLTGEYNGELL